MSFQLLRDGLERDELKIAHPAVVEFVTATTRPWKGRPALLTPDEARREAEELLARHEVLFPTEALVRTFDPFRRAARGGANRAAAPSGLRGRSS